MLIKLLKGFGCALRGIFYTLKNERHMRIHAVALVYVMFFSVFFNLSAEKYAILLLTGALVIVSEIINSAIESVVDICKNEYSIIAKIAKDMAAGAVLISAIFSVIIAILFFNDISGYVNILKFSNYITGFFPTSRNAAGLISTFAGLALLFCIKT